MYLNLLKTIRRIVNIISDGEESSTHDSRMKGIAWDILQILVKHNINEN